MKPLSEQTLYEILEVPSDAAASDIEAAYERVRSLYAPGSLATYALMSEEEASLLASRIEAAKATLLDTEARARYDETLAHEPEAHGLGTNGAAGATTPVPPVIPAAPQPFPTTAAGTDEEDEEDEDDEDDAVDQEPARLLGAAARSAGAPQETTTGRSPIRLDREIPAPAAAQQPAAPRPAVPPAASQAAPSQPAEPPRSDVSEWTGDALRAAREARGVTIQQIADRTKVTRHHIENIEAERFGALPAPVYLRGIILSLSRELRLDGQKVARSYLERAGASGGQPAQPAPPKPR